MDNLSEGNNNVKVKEDPKYAGIPQEQLTELTKEEFEDLPDGAFMALSSVRRSGKTVLLKWILNMLKDIKFYDIAMLFSESAHLQDEDYNYIPKRFRFQMDGFEDKLEKLIERQTELIKKYKDKEKVAKVLIIFDDCQSSGARGGKQFRNSAVLQKLAIFSRHINVSVILLIHNISMNGISSNNRKQLDMVFTFKSLNVNEKRYYAEHFLSYEDSLEARRKAFSTMNNLFDEPYKAMAIKLYKAQDSQKLEDILYWIKADHDQVKEMDFKLGHKKFWRPR